MMSITVKDLQTLVGVFPDGTWGSKTEKAVLAALTNTKAPALTEADYQKAADKMRVSIAHVKAIKKVESGAAGSFSELGRPTILTEPHIFSKQTQHRFDSIDNYASYAKYKTRPYPKTQAERWSLLMRMAKLDHNAAFESASYGLFQVMGFHWKSFGMQSSFHFAKSMADGEAGHLDALVNFIIVNSLDDELRACKKDDPASCVGFVRRYNGSAYATNNYHTKLAKAL
jgi:hypothetical protein